MEGEKGMKKEIKIKKQTTKNNQTELERLEKYAAKWNKEHPIVRTNKFKILKQLAQGRIEA